MSDTLRHDEAENRTNATPTMFPPARELPDAAREAALDAVERALAASLRLRRALPPAPLPPAPQLREEQAERRRHEPQPSQDDPAIRRLRERLEPVVMRAPPPDARASRGAMLAWVGGAVALAALVALLAVGAVPLPFGTKAEAEAGVMWSRVFADRGRTQAAPEPDAAASAEQAALAERFIAARRPAEPPQATVMVPQTVKVERVVVPQPLQPAPALQPARPAPQSARVLDSDELTALYDRSLTLVEQGDIASARLMLTRAAEAGDARSALALGATYDPDALKKLGVIGIAADPAQARVWYAKAIELGSAEAMHRLEKLAQATR